MIHKKNPKNPITSEIPPKNTPKTQTNEKFPFRTKTKTDKTNNYHPNKPPYFMLFSIFKMVPF